MLSITSPTRLLKIREAGVARHSRPDTAVLVRDPEESAQAHAPAAVFYSLSTELLPAAKRIDMCAACVP